MIFLMYVAQVFVGDMSVYLSGNNTVANMWRITCGVTFFEIPALMACCFTILSTDLLVSAPLFLFFSNCTKSASLMSLRAERYTRKYFFESSERNTTRTFPPFPRIESSSERKSISEVREQSSETRSPVENKSSSMALSRKSFSSLPLGEFSSLFNSSFVIRSSVRSETLASSMRSAGRDFTSCLARYFKNARKAIR